RRAWTQTSGAVAVLGVCVVWAYWPTLEGMGDRLAHDPQYSHGLLVPLFALVGLWSRPPPKPRGRPRPSSGGLPLLAAAVALRLAAAYVGLGSLEGPSLLLSLAGVCLLVVGGPALRWTWPAIGFLAFMLPLPYTVEMALAHPLRNLATTMSTYALQT